MNVATMTTLTIAGTLWLAGCNDSDFRGASERDREVQSKEFTQITRQVISKTFTQGDPGVEAVETFDQGEWGKLDLLVVVDNSGSMKEEQANLSTKLQPLLSKVGRSDWQIRVVTTDAEVNDCVGTTIRKGEANIYQRFADAVLPPVPFGQKRPVGSGLERGAFMAVRGLTCPEAPWLRDSSTVAVLFVTDEDNCHIDKAKGYGCKNLSERDGTILAKTLGDLRTPGQDARIYGILWHPNTAPSQCRVALKTGDVYAALINNTNGTWGSICDSDYTPTLEAISEDVSQILKYQIDLGQTPNPGTVQVLVDGQLWDRFSVSGSRIFFTEPPPFGSTVEIKYRHGGEGGISGSLKLEPVPMSDSISVEVNGQKVSADQFHWNNATQSLEFNEPLGEGASIKVSYKEEAPLPNEFKIGTEVNPETIEVTVDGKRVSSVTYDKGEGKITVAPAPSEGAKIKVTWRK